MSTSFETFVAACRAINQADSRAEFPCSGTQFSDPTRRRKTFLGHQSFVRDMI